MKEWAEKQKGFTIIELLIVIVVIAILATITIVAYNGLQQRSNNSSITDAASKSLRMINAYIAMNGKYPMDTANGTWCITTASGCVVNNVITGGNATFDTNIATIGVVPRSIPMSGGNSTGVVYSYSSSRTYNGDSQPALLFYWLYGTGQQCGLSGIVTGWTTSVSSTTGYTVANDNATDKTLCYVRIPGPGA